MSTSSSEPSKIPSVSHRLALFASGNGSNALRLIEYFREHQQIEVGLVVCNKPGAGVLEKAATAGIPILMIGRERFSHGDAYLPELAAHRISFIVLAGFLWKIPATLIEAFPGRIVNIHPALLPAYGGKGMWGHHVHTAVLASGDQESGITIHYVDEHYDHGAPIFQARCPVLPTDTPDTLAGRIHELEHLHFPHIVEELVLNTAPL
jgi:phosphoribosylglycinamide formyltransferase-1